METGIDTSPFPYGDHRYHTGIQHKWIPVTIRGSQYGSGDCHIPIWKWLITVSIWGLKKSLSLFPYGDPRMETGIDASPFPYGDYPVTNPFS